MKALLCTRYCTPEELELADIAEPTAGPGEAAVRVRAAALNFFDTLIIAGKYQHKPPFPFSPAAEFAGEIESVGADVTGFAPGDRVIGNIGWGAAREKVAVATDRLVAMPAGLDFDHAAGLTVIYGTTMHALNDRAKLKAGETLAVLGAAGGTGLAAVELGKLIGARVIACASSDDKIAFAKQHGADDGVNYAASDLKDSLRALTGGKGVDVVYDPIGGAQGEAALRGMDWGGRYLVIGFARRLLGRLDAARSARPPRQHDEDSRVVCAGQAVVARARGLSAERSGGRAQGDCRTQSDGQGDTAALEPGHGAARRFAVRRADAVGDELNRGHQHRGIVGETDDRQHVGNGVDRQHEISDRRNERRLHAERRIPVEGAIIGRKQFLGEWNPRGHTLELAPEVALKRAVVVAAPECRACECHEH
jgi:NADPH2:quinone reductase